MSKFNNQLDKDEIKKKLADIDNQEDNDDEKQNSEEDEQNDKRRPGDDESQENDERDESDEQEDDEESLDGKKDDEVKDEGKNNEPDIDYEEKFKHSTREAQILLSKNKKLTETIDQAASLAEPTEQDLSQYAKSEGLDYSELTNTEKIMLKKSYLADRRFSMVNEAVQETKKIDEWASKVDELLEKNETNTKYPQLIGKETEFKIFAMKPSRRGVDMEDLIKAFSFDVKPVTKKKGSLFATANGGEKAKVKTSMDDADEIARIRRTDPRRYRELIKNKKIKVDY